MKIRIKGNSVRIRLSKPEVKKLCEAGCLEERTLFVNNSLTYALQVAKNKKDLSAVFNDNQITVLIPEEMIKGWEHNNTISFESNMKINETVSLHLLVEKDFKCIDNTTEDQTDNYDHLAKVC